MNKSVLYIVILVFILFIVGLIIGGSVGYSLAPKLSKDTVYKRVDVPIIMIDTLRTTKVVYKDRIVDNWDTIKIKKIDSFYVSLPFTAYVDTVVNLDTIKFNYKYPENIFLDFNIKSKPIYVPQVQAVEIKRAWYVDLLTHLGAFGLGFGVGKWK